MWLLIGGHIELNENPEEALRREMKEELNFVPDLFRHFKKYEFDDFIFDIFLAEVGDDFENKITILEGEYGAWFTMQDVLAAPKFIEYDSKVLLDFFKFQQEQKD